MEWVKKMCEAFHRKPISELQSVTCHTGSQPARLVLDLLIPERLIWPWWLVIYWNGSAKFARNWICKKGWELQKRRIWIKRQHHKHCHWSVKKQSPTQILTRHGIKELWRSDALTTRSTIDKTKNSDQCQDVWVDVLGSVDWSQVDRLGSNGITTKSSVVLQHVARTVLSNSIPNTHTAVTY